MSGSSADAVLLAIRVALLANAPVAAIVGTRILDWPAPDSTYPMITLGDVIDEPMDTDSYSGASLVVTVHTWARGATARQVARQLGEAVTAVLHRGHAGLAVTGHQVIAIQRGVGFVELEGDSDTAHTSGVAHGLYRFQITTQAA